jgi:heme/copper-type cytochrome/quinol oxidase subunit 4
MIINLLLGLAVLTVIAFLVYISETFDWGEDAIAVLLLIGLAYFIGWLLRWLF